MKSHKRREPCGNCPFRRDAPLAYWHPTMYEMLARLETNEHELGAHGFACHKDAKLPDDEREHCVGWLINQRERGVPNLGLRMSLTMGEHSEAACAQFNEAQPNGAQYATVTELVEANIARDRELHPERYEID